MKVVNVILFVLVIAGAVAIFALRAQDRHRPPESTRPRNPGPSQPKATTGGGGQTEPRTPEAGSPPDATPLEKKWAGFLKACETDGKNALLNFGDFLREPHPELRRQLAEALSHPTKEVRMAAVMCLGAEKDEEVSTILTHHIDTESDLTVRATYWQAFSKHANDPATFEKLQSLLRTDNAPACSGSVFALSSGGEPAAATVALMNAYNSLTDGYRKYIVAGGIGRLAERGHPAAQDELVRIFRATQDAGERKGLYAWIKKAGLLSRLTQGESDEMEGMR